MIRTTLILVAAGWILSATGVFGAIQKITVYEGDDATGNSITLRRKTENLTDFKQFLNLKLGQYFCFTGMNGPNSNFNQHFSRVSAYFEEGSPTLWAFYSGENFERIGPYYSTKVANCTTVYTFGYYNSARYIGPEDFNTPAIAFYETPAPYWVSGRELVVTGLAASNFTFVPDWSLSFGRSNWTVFTGENFDGESRCFPTSNSITDFTYTGSTGFGTPPVNFIVKSVAQGCDPAEVERNILLFKSSVRE